MPFDDESNLPALSSGGQPWRQTHIPVAILRLNQPDPGNPTWSTKAANRIVSCPVLQRLNARRRGEPRSVVRKPCPFLAVIASRTFSRRWAVACLSIGRSIPPRRGSEFSWSRRRLEWRGSRLEKSASRALASRAFDIQRKPAAAEKCRLLPKLGGQAIARESNHLSRLSRCMKSPLS